VPKAFAETARPRKSSKVSSFSEGLTDSVKFVAGYGLKSEKFLCAVHSGRLANKWITLLTIEITHHLWMSQDSSQSFSLGLSERLD
jgi:hypothetical protein